jgi:hypothetical protein
VIEIRSYRRVFDLERRIYSVDQLRLNPTGVPVRGVVYFLVGLALALLIGALPVIGLLAAELPWYVRDLAFPGATATVLSAIRLEGRTFHLAALALARYWFGPRTFVGGGMPERLEHSWQPPELVLLPDGSDSRLRRMRYTGPGAVLVSVEHERGGGAVERGTRGLARVGRRRTVSLAQLDPPRPAERAQVIALGQGARLVVRGGRASRATTGG